MIQETKQLLLRRHLLLTLRLLVGPYKGPSEGTVECRKQCPPHQLCGKARSLFLGDVSYNTPIQADGHANA